MSDRQEIKPQRQKEKHTFHMPATKSSYKGLFTRIKEKRYKDFAACQDQNDSKTNSLPTNIQNCLPKEQLMKPSSSKNNKNNQSSSNCQNQNSTNVQVKDKTKNLISEDKNKTKKDEKSSHEKKPTVPEKKALQPFYGRRLPQSLVANPKVSKIYRKLYWYTLSSNKLKTSGYPLESKTDPDKININVKYTKLPNDEDSNVNVCHRCFKEFSILDYTNSDADSSKTVCYFHNGKKMPRDDSGNSTIFYDCCSKPSDSTGCQTFKYHVCRFQNFENEKFIKTSKISPGISFDIYALDCEMCYTTKGLEVTRITIIDINKTVVYDTYVVPENKIIDYNTLFSGITADHLKNVKTTLADVQAYLLKLLTANTILIGHSLDHDFRALRLVHLLVVDTYMVFLEDDKRSLQNLASTHLGKVIQQGDHGHNSVEDACTCIELMKWKIAKDDHKRILKKK